jgi:hypothetical protein
MGDSGRSARLAEQAAIFQQKRLITDQVRMRFSRFGDEVLAIVLGYALQPKRMPILLQKCNIRSFPDLENQLGALWSYIAEHGPRDFVKRIRVEKREEVKPLDLEALGAAAAEDEFDPETMTLEGVIARALKQSGIAPVLDPVQPISETKKVSVPGYSGPDRRSGSDRRSGGDRRDQIASIKKNHRYGGERRKRPRGRRRTDCSK